jgi:hypothetical protein
MVGKENEGWPRRILDPPSDPWQTLHANIRYGREKASHVRLWYHANEGVLTSARDGALVTEISFLNGTLRTRDFRQSSEVIRIGEPLERGFAKVTDPFLGPLRLFERGDRSEWDVVRVGVTQQFVSRRSETDLTELVIDEKGWPTSARYRGGLVRWIGLTVAPAAGPPIVDPAITEGWRRERYRMLSRAAVFEPLGGVAPERVSDLRFEDAFEYQSSRMSIPHRHASWRSEERELKIVIRPERRSDSASTNAGGTWTIRLRDVGTSADDDTLGWVAHIYPPLGMPRDEAMAPLADLNVVEASPWILVDDDEPTTTRSEDRHTPNENTRTREAGGSDDNE